MLKRYFPPGSSYGQRDFSVSEGDEMIKVNASQDKRYGVTLSNGVSVMGARQVIIKTAAEAAKEGICVVAWTVPGKQNVRRLHAAEFLHSEYQRQLSLL